MNTTLHAFPRFTTHQMQIAQQYGEVRKVQSDEILIEKGQRDFPFYVVISGSIKILEFSHGEPREVAIHSEGQFTGDIDMLTRRPTFISAIAGEESEVIEIPSDTLRRLLNEIPGLSDMLLIAFQTRREILEASGFEGIRVFGMPFSKDTLRVREFFYRNQVPHTFYDISTPEGSNLAQELEIDLSITPVLRCSDTTIYNPPVTKIAECLGISREVKDKVYDLVVVGAGPAGLSTAVYSASEGIKTLVLDSVGPGGQAGGSSKIENLIGYPSGLSGVELASKAYLQALKFGAEFSAPIAVTKLSSNAPFEHELSLCTGDTVVARAVVIATGISYRQLEIQGCRKYEGAGVYYAATSVEARLCGNSTAVIIGAGNSAGQAAMYLAETAKRVVMVVRSDAIEKSMSSYLSERIYKTSNIEVKLSSEVVKMYGDEQLRGVTIASRENDTSEKLDCSAVFLFIGGKPHTTWLPDSVSLDPKGFVMAGATLERGNSWTVTRTPCDLETSVPGIFVAGDVRSGTTKRCGFALGDGALATSCIHRHLSYQ